MQDLKITLVQTNIEWGDKDANLNRIEELIDHHDQDSDLIILPEMFNTGFSMEAEKYAEPMNGPTVQKIKRLSAAHSAAICGSLIIEDEGQYYNRFIMIQPNGNLEHYDKRHPFSFLGEHEIYTAGTNKKIMELMGWKISPMVCYDLRFPAWCRNQDDFDLQIFVANWPAKRSHHWLTLLQSRAIENQSYVVGVNRVGLDYNDNDHDGNSSVFDYAGSQLFNKVNEETIKTINLSKQKLIDYRKRYPFLNDRDEYEFKR